MLTVFVAVFLLSASSALPVEEQAPSQEIQPQPISEEQTAEKVVPLEKAPEEAEIAPPPDAVAPVPAEEKSDLDTANTFWGGYYRRPYYGGWGGYGGGWRRGWGGGYGYGRGFGGWGGYGGWGWGGRTYWG
jgi:hypothetical protein